MQSVPAHAQQVTPYPYPLDNKPGSRSISDDDICAWCRHLYYRPGERSLCRLVEVNGSWPACFDPDGYAQSCTELQVIFTPPQ
ncbi:MULTISPECIES: hypothetical protein [unclassified Serratia (in: enterobacteria)]|uniref:hypothetical protein n=1 Tax=unclassified Serratia (in: enterobacteria) TaxID=2647522 RepID=UPI0030763E2C